MRILPKLGTLETETEKLRCAYITTQYENPYWKILVFIYDVTPVRIGSFLGIPFDYADALWRRYYARHPEKEPNQRWFRGSERNPK